MATLRKRFARSSSATFDRGVLSNIELRTRGGRIGYIFLMIGLVILAILFIFPHLFRRGGRYVQ